jgi:hypothetical protein
MVSWTGGIPRARIPLLEVVMKHRPVRDIVAVALLLLPAAAWGAGCGGNEQSSSASVDAGPDEGSSVLDGSPDGPLDATSARDVSSPEASVVDGTFVVDAGPRQCPAPTMDAAPVVTPPALSCSPFALEAPAIASFAGGSSWAFGSWGKGPVAGGTFAYPSCNAFPPEPANPLFQDFASSSWHITGTVGTYSGFGLWWEVATEDSGAFQGYGTGVLDLSAFAGIQFDVSGDPGPLGVLTFNVQSAAQQASATTQGLATCGTCQPDAGSCLDSTASVSGITTTPRTVSLYWTDFTAKGTTAFDPATTVAMNWSLPWVVGATPYPVDITLANLQFISLSDAGGD